jgi:branched-chain amino acid aminotransferase
MSINLNGTVYPALPEEVSNVTRAMFYGDGLFETIRVFKGRLPFLGLHWDRLQNGLKTLGFEVPAHWSSEFFGRQILQTTQGNARVRLTVWRTSGGFFLPSDNSPQFLITSSTLDKDWADLPDKGLSLQLCDKVQLPTDQLAGLKILGGTRYVAAANEARSKNADDVVILNSRGMVCETSNSNILWVSKGIVFAPSPTDGQVTGTYQKILFEQLRGAGIPIVEKSADFTTLLSADELFITNAIQGIRWVQFLEGTEYTCKYISYFNKLMVNYLEKFLI